MKLLALLAGLVAAVVMVAGGFSVPPPGMEGWQWLLLACGGTIAGWGMILAVFDVLAGTQAGPRDRKVPEQRK